MTNRQESREAKIDRLAKNLAKLVDIFRQGKQAKDFNWWNSESIFNPLFGYQEGQPIFEEVVQGVLGLNPQMLSEHEVQRRLIYDFLMTQTVSWREAEHLNNQSLVNAAKDFLNELIELDVWQDVDIPIANLWNEGEPIEFLRVTFRGATESELKQWEKNLKVFWHEGTHNVHVLARVRAPGDEKKAIEYARVAVNTVLEVFRAFCFPFGRESSSWRVGVVGDIISYTSTPMSINSRHFLSQSGAGGSTVLELKQIISQLEQQQWEMVSKFILKEKHNGMENKLFDSIHWLAEATKPDTNNARFAKIGFALETLIGGEPKDEDLKVRGITAMLAERAAFIAGTNIKDRQDIDKKVRRNYAKRSSIVHGSEGEASLQDIYEFGSLVRRLALALLEKLDKLGDKIDNVEKLENWVKLQRYTLPEDTN